jgi:hypothetical protein
MMRAVQGTGLGPAPQVNQLQLCKENTMKSRIFRSGVVAVCLAALAWPLAAATTDGNAPAVEGARAQLKQRLDANHDGKIDPQERAAAVENFKANHPRLYAAILKKFDANGDGKLDEQERAAAREAIKAKLQELRQKFDTNGDGKLDEQERAAAREAIKARIQQRRAEAGQK